MSQAHTVFLSYHYGVEDRHRASFEAILSEMGAVTIGASTSRLDAMTLGADEQAHRRLVRQAVLADASIVVALISGALWKRRHVDWELAAALAHDEHQPRLGLMSVILPSHYNAYSGVAPDHYTPCNLPPRLYDQIEAGYASIHGWPQDASTLGDWLELASQRAKTQATDDSRALLAKDRAEGSRSWSRAKLHTTPRAL